MLVPPIRRPGPLLIALALLLPSAAAARERCRKPYRQLPTWCDQHDRICFPIDLYVSIVEDASASEIEALKRPLQEASERLYHASGGHLFIGRVKVRDRRTDGGFRFSFHFDKTPHGGFNIPMGPDHWWDRTIFHELGHLKLGLWDEYRYEPTCPDCVMALNSYEFCHEGHHRGHNPRRRPCWTRLRRLFPGLPPYAKRPKTTGEHAPPIVFEVIDSGRR